MRAEYWNSHLFNIFGETASMKYSLYLYKGRILQLLLIKHIWGNCMVGIQGSILGVRMRAEYYSSSKLDIFGKTKVWGINE